LFIFISLAVISLVKAVLEKDRKMYPKGLSSEPSPQESQSDLQTEMNQLVEASQLSGSGEGQDGFADDGEDSGQTTGGQETENGGISALTSPEPVNGAGIFGE
jgi:hypothetical protein